MADHRRELAGGCGRPAPAGRLARPSPGIRPVGPGWPTRPRTARYQHGADRGSVRPAGRAAAPAAVAGPTVLSPAALAPEMTRVAPHVIIDRDGWVPWTPTPHQATYNLALSCSNGHGIGQFREAVEPASGSQVPAGNV